MYSGFPSPPSVSSFFLLPFSPFLSLSFFLFPSIIPIVLFTTY